MPSSGYSSGEMLRMQQDALRRVREMQQRANEKLSQAQPTATPPPVPVLQEALPVIPVPAPPEAPPPVTQPRATPIHTQAAPRQNPPHQPPPKSNSPLSFLSALFPSASTEQEGEKKGFLARLGVDEEQAFLVVILLMLLREGADHKLILALCYLLL